MSRPSDRAIAQAFWELAEAQSPNILHHTVIERARSLDGSSSFAKRAARGREAAATEGAQCDAIVCDPGYGTNPRSCERKAVAGSVYCTQHRKMYEPAPKPEAAQPERVTEAMVAQLEASVDTLDRSRSSRLERLRRLARMQTQGSQSAEPIGYARADEVALVRNSPRAHATLFSQRCPANPAINIPVYAGQPPAEPLVLPQSVEAILADLRAATNTGGAVGGTQEIAAMYQHACVRFVQQHGDALVAILSTSARDRKEAERYRWLRDNKQRRRDGDYMNPAFCSIEFYSHDEGVIGPGKSIDSAIDAAMGVEHS